MSHAVTTLREGVADRAIEGAGALSRARSSSLALIETSKPRIVRLVTVTSMVGFAAAAVALPRPEVPSLLAVGLACAVGTALSAAGANALNQWMERDRDARMARTRTRPLPQGRLASPAVLVFGAATGLAGVVLLWAACGLAPALVSFVCLASYVLAYTPLKPRTTLATYVGAIPGALPPMIGWTAAHAMAGHARWPAGLDGMGGWTLVAIMFAWQIPHFLAIAWMYRDDYAAGGFRVLPVVDQGGRATIRTMLAWTAILIPLMFLPLATMPGRVGVAYAAAAAGSAVAFAVLAAGLARSRSRDAARALFLGSVIVLPILFAALVGEAIVRAAMG